MMVSKAIVAGIVIVAILLVLFYLSPYSEINTVKCYTPQNVPNSGGAELGPTCGIVIDPSPLFPFRSPSSEFIEFCRRNIATIEDSCNVTVETAWVAEFSNASDAYECNYIFDNSTSAISLDKFAEPLTPNDTEMTDNLDMVYLKDFAVSISSGQVDYDPSKPQFDYKKCTDLKARLR